MSRSRRIEVDVNKLIHSNFNVELENDNLKELIVEFPGPQDTPYEGGVWLVRVELPDSYPYHSPSVGFKTPIFHPNVDEKTGSVCLDVINQTWTPIFGLVNIFESFLPQLLAYPNAADPLNRRAALLCNYSEQEYFKEIRRYVEQFATKKQENKVPNNIAYATLEKPASVDEKDGLLTVNGNGNGEGAASDSELSSLEDFSDTEG